MIPPCCSSATPTTLRRDSTLLFVGHADDLAQAIGPFHPRWADAKSLGFNEIQLNCKVYKRIDRLQLCDRVVRRVQPLLNVVDSTEDRERQEAIRGGARA